MKKNRKIILILTLSIILVILNTKYAFAEPSVNLTIGGTEGNDGYVENIRLLINLTILSLLPSILIMVTSFSRIVIVFSFLKNALGIQQSIPNQVTIGLALFLTFFIMQPVYTEINNKALTPFSDGIISKNEAISIGTKPLKEFMLKETRQKDLQLFVEITNTDENQLTKENLSLVTLTPAFIISELRTAFLMGFILFIPFIVIDFVVSSVLMSMGMFMLPPAMVALPFKLLLFIMVDGWNILVKSLIQSFT